MNNKFFTPILIIIGVLAIVANLYLMSDRWWGDNNDAMLIPAQVPQQTSLTETPSMQTSSSFSPPPRVEPSSPVMMGEKELELRDQIDRADAEAIEEENDFISDANPESKRDFIQRYYRELKNVPYQQTWTMLSDNFQAGNTLAKYTNWWSKHVDSVYIDEVVAVKGQEVTVRLQYKMKNGKNICSLDTFSLIKSGSSWLLDKHRYRNC